MILVLGSTGTTGGEVARQLIAAGHKPRLLVRDPTKAKQFEGKAEIVKGDLEDAASVGNALKGVKQLFLVSTGTNGQQLEQQTIDAAKKAGVEHVVKLSVVGAENPQITFSKWHASTEKKLMESGMKWTMLRPGNFMTNAFGWIETIKSQGAVYQPTGEGKFAPVDPRDIGAVAVKALTESGHEGKGYTLTGPRSLNSGEQVAILSKAIGKPVKYVDVPPEAAKDGMLKTGMPAAYVDALLELMAIMKAGYADMVSPDFEKVTGKKGTTFEAWADRNAAAFK